jgi:hypothetical protein
MLAGVFRPDFYLAQGWRLMSSSGIWSAILATCLVATLPAVAVWAWRVQQRFHSALAGLCFIASLVGFWSALHIDREVVDHQVFWLSVVGVLNVAVTIATVPSARWATPRPRVGALVVTAVAVLLAVGIVTLGVNELTGTEREHANNPSLEELTVRSLTQQTFAVLRQLDIEKPLLRLDGDTWGIAAGMLVQFVKAGHPVAVDKSSITLFDRPWLATGNEDAVLTVCGPVRHRQLAMRSGNFVAAESELVFVDGIRITRVDSP